ncbi:flavodoxin [Pseudoflavonifractor phocaeensis]|nr:flavodoxin [Pseudoflavonifractor phocaeensis]
MDRVFSRADENYFSGVLRRVRVGNTEIAAQLLRELTGADLFKIEPVQPYSKDYNECIAQAQEDQRRDARPELKSCPNSLDGYGTVYLGYPNYWGTMPMAVFTFLERFDWNGKTIRPFCTHEGSGLGRSESDIRRLCPGAKVETGLEIYGSTSAKAGPAMKKWLARE